MNSFEMINASCLHISFQICHKLIKINTILGNPYIFMPYIALRERLANSYFPGIDLGDGNAFSPEWTASLRGINYVGHVAQLKLVLQL